MTEANKKMLRIFAGLGFLFACLLVALGFKVYYALATDQPVLTKNYYETGRMYDKYVKAHANTKNRRLINTMFEAVKHPHIPVKGFLKKGNNSLEIRYMDETGKGIAKAKVRLKLGRRSTNKEDFMATCKTDTRGYCQIHFVLPFSGYWEGSLKAEDPNGRFRYRGSFLAK